MTLIPRSRYDTYSGWESTITPLGRLMPITEFHCENRLQTNWHTRLLLLPRDLIVKCYYKHNLCSTTNLISRTQLRFVLSKFYEKKKH